MQRSADALHFTGKLLITHAPQKLLLISVAIYLVVLQIKSQILISAVLYLFGEV